MRKHILMMAIAALGAGTLVFAGCEREGAYEDTMEPTGAVDRTGENMQDAGRSAGQAIDRGVDETGQAVDRGFEEAGQSIRQGTRSTGDAMQDAGQGVRDLGTPNQQPQPQQQQPQQQQ